MDNSPASSQPICCPPFNPDPWDRKEIRWQDRLFLKDRVTSFLHIPLNFGSVMRRNMEKIQKAGALDTEQIVLSDKNSLWGADVYIAVSQSVAGSQTIPLSGTFLARVFEGPYKNIRRWMQEMETYVASQGRQIRKLYFFYTTCPRCAKKYGKNYVVLLAQI